MAKQCNLCKVHGLVSRACLTVDLLSPRLPLFQLLFLPQSPASRSHTTVCHGVFTNPCESIQLLLLLEQGPNISAIHTGPSDLLFLPSELLLLWTLLQPLLGPPFTKLMATAGSQYPCNSFDHKSLLRSLLVRASWQPQLTLVQRKLPEPLHLVWILTCETVMCELALPSCLSASTERQG